MRDMTANGLAAALMACAAGVMLCPATAAAQDQGTVEVNAEPSQVNREQPVAVPDPRDGLTAAPFDRAVQSAAAKSSALRGRRFSTRGWIAVQPSSVSAKRILAITRIDHVDARFLHPSPSNRPTLPAERPAINETLELGRVDELTQI